MRLAAFAIIMSFALPVVASSVTPPALKPDLAAIGFMIGDWQSGDGQVADTGGTSKGRAIISAEANGAVILSRAQTKLFDRAGKPAGGFQQLLSIYPDGGTLHADYSDGDHLIHYVSADVVPGKSVTFASAAAKGAPVFRLTYELTSPKIMTISFGMVPPGSMEFHPIAVGTATKK
jgi:hypothetical protein